ncbi:MAG: hypothetical protein EBU93_04495 [Chlamydiae bacterium]|nr:hypothetical protein [Chlamydiota bacterium]
MNVLLDLDQTCVLDVNSYQYSQIPNNYILTYITHIYSKDSIGSLTNILFARPHLQSFLSKVSKFATISVFTAASKKYADIVVDNLFAEVKPKHIFYRDDCLRGKKMFMDRMKPIEYVCELYPDEFSLENTWIIDDNEEVKKSNKNCILVKPWTLESLIEGCNDETKKDKALIEVLWSLRTIASQK